jgi:hypothetical protein
MMRTWTMLTVAAVLAAAAPLPATAGEADVKKQLTELNSKLDAISKQLEALAAKPSAEVILAEIKKLDNKLSGQIDKVKNDLKGDMEVLKDKQFNQGLALARVSERLQLLEDMMKLRRELPDVAVPSITLDKVALDDIRNRLAKIETALVAPSASVGRVSAFGPSGIISSGVGRVQLINLYSEPVRFTVNDRPYRVNAGETVQLDGVPAGTLTYDVFSDRWGVLRTRTTTTLLPNETQPLIVHRVGQPIP